MKPPPNKSKPFYPANINVAVHTLYSRLWSTHGYDRKLRRALRACLRAVRVRGIFILLGRRNTFIELIDPACPSGIPDFLRQRLRTSSPPKAANELPDTPESVPLPHDYHAAIVHIHDDSFPEGIEHGSIACAACFARHADPNINERLTELCGKTFLPIIADVMRHRERRFHSIPAQLSQHYWESSAYPPTSRADVPPWDRGDHTTPTATLSIDMRKSTKAMEQADNPARFADWLDELVQIISEIAHRHGGIFDKFTGDGALVHFLQDACRTLYNGKSATVLALECAREIHRAIHDCHLPRLRRMLHTDSKKFGIGCAIAYSHIHWKLDYRDNPITVGRGAVEACRLCDATPATYTTVTNLVYERLRPRAPALAQIFEHCDFTSKEHNADDGARAYQAPLSKLLATGGDPQVVRDICRAVYKRTRARRKQERRGRHAQAQNLNKPGTS